MADSSDRPIASPPQSIPSSFIRSSSPATNRETATARLGTPVNPSALSNNPLFGDNGTISGSPASNNNFTSSNFPQERLSAFNTPPTRFGTPPRYSTPPVQVGTPNAAREGSIYGSFDSRRQLEDPEVIRRHLVTEEDVRAESSSKQPADNNDEFSSLQLQGGDITRGIYRYVEGNDPNKTLTRGRSKSFRLPRPENEEGDDISAMKVPQGFRRNFVRQKVSSPHPNASAGSSSDPNGQPQQPRLFTQSFFEFLSLYGHFAGEELEEEDESEDWSDTSRVREGDDEEEPDETSGLIPRAQPPKVHKKKKPLVREGGSLNAALLLLKGFVGTGVLFLPKAFSNGGMAFSTLVLLFVAALSYYCFVLLVKTRLKVPGSFGDIGGAIYGPKMRFAILFSIVISQIGFAAAYIVFTSTNLQAFITAVSSNDLTIDVKWLILLQLIIFMPLSMIRDISKLGGTALIADFFILLGLVYLYYFDFFTLASEGVSDIVQFNSESWTLFIGTAIFTFEGIGLLIPIQETMRKPEKFPRVLAIIMVIITGIFVSMGAFSYAAFGSKTETVVILNLPQDSKFVNGVQFLYSLAILLSTPLQLFPAIRIMETSLFTRSGKHSALVKWKKNVFRFFVVMATALISWGGADDLDKFVALIGSFACIPLVYMYPPLLHMKVVAKTTAAKALDLGLCAFGLAVMVYTTWGNVKSWIEE